MDITNQKIVPNLWFDKQAKEAVNFYISAFGDAKMGKKAYATKAAESVSGIPAGSLLTIEFDIDGFNFVALNGGPAFVFTPAISFLAACKTKEEVDKLWEKLAESGTTLMEIGEYPFSKRYGWTQDRYSLSWQAMLYENTKITQKIIPTLMFTGEKAGKAEEAINFYTSFFYESEIGHITRYGRGMEPDKEGTVQHAEFTLEGIQFAAMDSALEHKFTFNEAVSLMVGCDSQEQIDYYWEKLTQGGEEGVCGWLKDKYGISWQVTPNVLREMLMDKDREKVERVTAAFLKMKKFNIEELKAAFKGRKQASGVTGK